MAIEKRLKATKGRRKTYSYRVKWRHQGTGSQQSKTVESEAEANQLEAALKKAGWKHLSTDPEVKYLTLIGAGGRTVAEPVAVKGAGLTVHEAVRRWANRPGLSRGSKRIYTQVTDRLGTLGNKMVPDLTAEEVDEWFNRQAEVLSSNTLQIMRIAVKGALATYDRQDAMANLARVAPRREVVPIFLTPLELDALVAKAEERYGRNFATLIRLVGTMGPRWGEVMALTVGSLSLDDEEHAHLWVRQALKNDARLRDGFKPEAVKTVGSERMVPLTRELTKLLRETTEGCGSRDVVFKPTDAAFWNHRTFIYKWNRLCEATPEVPDEMRFHDLRHTAAKNMLERGVPIAYVSKILGHSKVDITVKEYGSFDQRSHDLVRNLMN